jgi:hypothetical protein
MGSHALFSFPRPGIVKCDLHLSCIKATRFNQLGSHPELRCLCDALARANQSLLDCALDILP